MNKELHKKLYYIEKNNGGKKQRELTKYLETEKEINKKHRHMLILDDVMSEIL